VNSGAPEVPDPLKWVQDVSRPLPKAKGIRYICPGFPLNNQSGSHDVAEKLLKVKVTIYTNNLNPRKNVPISFLLGTSLLYTLIIEFCIS
jgi:hypothetical protein